MRNPSTNKAIAVAVATNDSLRMSNPNSAADRIPPWFPTSPPNIGQAGDDGAAEHDDGAASLGQGRQVGHHQAAAAVRSAEADGRAARPEQEEGQAVADAY